MRAYDSLSRRADFARLRRRGRRLETPHLTIVAAPASGGRPKVAFVTVKAFGGAVERNRARRRVRAAFDRLPQMQGRGFDLILTARPSAGGADFAALCEQLSSALARLGS
ncbi:MAG: ribonuclease P protein component [Candidatus Eremiobacteraeota bacterium]|nr:ribonuclease P protein component [Candidatus Eremiobacteraeota bacterium]